MSDTIPYLIARAVADPFYLGSALATYARSEALDWPGLAEALQCSPAQLAALALCRRPDPEGADFEDACERIAERFLFDPLLLVEVLRRAEVLDTWRESEVASGQRGWLAAARDRELADGVHLYSLDLDSLPEHADGDGSDDEDPA